MNPTESAPDAHRFLKALFEVTAPHWGDDFLRVMCKELATLFSADVAFVAQLKDEPGQAKILAAWPHQWAGVSYALSGTPCELVYGGQVVALEKNVAMNFPAEHGTGFETYLGIPLIRRDGGCRGHLSVYGKTARAFDPAIDEIGQLFARRVEVETERLEFEAERASLLTALQELNTSLETRVLQRTTELEQALAQVQESRDALAHSEAKATLSTLIASVSHELGTPIGNSNMVATTLMDQARSMGETIKSGQIKRSDLERFLGQVTACADLLQLNLQRAASLLGDFRQVAADQASEQRRTFSLADVVGEILHTLSPTLKRQPHRVHVDIPALIVMDSQPGPLGQIVINLVNNAYLHAFEGRTNGVLTIRARRDGEQVELQFSDNGVGMTPQQLDKLFDPFFSTKIGKGGTGLGMAIVQNMVTKTLGGTIEVTSSLGQGTCFTIRLPGLLPQ